MKKSVDVKNLEENTDNQLDVVTFFETWAQIWGDRYGYVVEVTSIKNIETGEELKPPVTKRE